MVLVLGFEHVCESLLIIPRNFLPFFYLFLHSLLFSSIFSSQAWGGSKKESWRCQDSLSVTFRQVLLILIALESCGPRRANPGLDHVQTM